MSRSKSSMWSWGLESSTRTTRRRASSRARDDSRVIAPGGMKPGAGPSLQVAPVIRDSLHLLARNGYPDEVCGLLIGSVRRQGTVIERVTLSRNLVADRPRERYVLDPGSFVIADHLARNDGFEIVGFWHSLPDRPPIPSATDLEAAWKGYSYVTVSVRQQGTVDVRAWRLADDGFVAQRIEAVAD